MDDYITIRVLRTQAEALREVLEPEALSIDDCYSAAAIAVLLYIPLALRPAVARGGLEQLADDPPPLF